MSRIVPTVLAIADAYVKEYETEYEEQLKLMQSAIDRNDLQAVAEHAQLAEFCRFASKTYSEVRTKHQNRNRL